MLLKEIDADMKIAFRWNEIKERARTPIDAKPMVL